MEKLRFSWNDQKAAANEEKHGVPFEEAVTVFWDENALLLGDPDHSDFEERFLLLGLSSRLRLLVVCHAVWVDPETIRVINARKATKPERTQYLKRLRA
ncbi:MAG TPA: BrnT family toxin [Acidobacteriota bacterium]|nr:BrnT family toxin [Acidobacteriota bacterium]